MEKRDAKILALEFASIMLGTSAATLERVIDDANHDRVVLEINRIAESLRKRAEWLKERGKR